MRRILFTVVLGFTLGMLAGCHCCQSGGHTQGICDCEGCCDDACYTRAPWAFQGAPASSHGLEHRKMPAADLPKN